MAALASTLTTLGRAQIYAASADADARGAGRGPDLPTGPMPALAYALDFGTRAVADGDFNWATGQTEIAALFIHTVGDVFTTNGPAAHVFVPGGRGPSPSVPCYCKAFNAAILDDDDVHGLPPVVGERRQRELSQKCPCRVRVRDYGRFRTSGARILRP